MIHYMKAHISAKSSVQVQDPKVICIGLGLEDCWLDSIHIREGLQDRF